MNGDREPAPAGAAGETGPEAKRATEDGGGYRISEDLAATLLGLILLSLVLLGIIPKGIIP